MKHYIIRIHKIIQWLTIKYHRIQKHPKIPCKAVGVERVIRKSELVSSLPSIQYPLDVQIEEVRAVLLIVHFASPVSLVLCYQITRVFALQFILRYMLLNSSIYCFYIWAFVLRYQKSRVFTLKFILRYAILTFSLYSLNVRKKFYE